MVVFICELCDRKMFGLPIVPRKWIVSVHTVGKHIVVEPDGDGVCFRPGPGGTPGYTAVHEPGPIATFFGDTLEKRLQRARAKAQKVCDRMNHDIQKEIEHCKLLKSGR